MVTKAPEAKTLKYTGSAQELVTAGEATGGEMQYALGTATEATEPYAASIPAKTEAGTYYVWYKAAGDENHNDSEAKFVISTISKKDETIPDTKPATYTVTLTGGANATADGAAEQTVEQGKAMATVTYVANEGFHFDSFDPIKSNGVSATFADGKVVVSGTPTADAKVAVPDAVADPVPGEPRVTYAAHVAGPGWLPYVSDGETAGTTGELKWQVSLDR